MSATNRTRILASVITLNLLAGACGDDSGSTGDAAGAVEIRGDAAGCTLTPSGSLVAGGGVELVAVNETDGILDVEIVLPEIPEGVDPREVAEVTGGDESSESTEYRLLLRPDPGSTTKKTVVLTAGTYPVVCVTDTTGGIAGEIRIAPAG